MTDDLDTRLRALVASGADVYVANVTYRQTRARQWVVQISRPGEPPRPFYGPTPSAALAAAMEGEDRD